MANSVLELSGVNKQFPGVQALKNVNFTLEEGDIHALIGENGAGKSTLIKIVAGIHKPDEGSIKLFEKPITIHNPHEARSLGIAIIHQERNLISELSIAENIFLDRYPKTKLGTINWKQLYKESQKILQERLKVNLNVREMVKNHSVANQQLIEIANALSLHPKIMVLDEPTSSLTEAETQRLFEIMKALKANNVSMIYITHKLEELGPVEARSKVA